MVFGVEEYYAMGGIEAHYGGRRSKFVGASMSASTNYCDFLNVYTPYYARSGGFDFALYFARYVYSLNYAVVTLSIYRGEEYSLVEMSVLQNWWLVNRAWNNEIMFQLNGSIEPMYEVSTTIKVDHRVISITQTLNYHYNHNNQSTSPTPTSVVF